MRNLLPHATILTALLFATLSYGEGYITISPERVDEAAIAAMWSSKPATTTVDLATQDMTNGGTITADAFVGDGSGLTNLPATSVSAFTGAGTTGTVTSAIGDAGNYLQADGTWTAVVTTPPETNSTTLEFTQPTVAFTGTRVTVDQLRATEVIMDIVELTGISTSLAGGSVTIPMTNYSSILVAALTDLTITSVPSLGLPLHTNDNYHVWLSNATDYNITIEDELNLPGSLLDNGGNDITLKPQQSILMSWSSFHQEWHATTPKGGPLANQFLGKDDTPDTYTGSSLNYVRVNAGEDALEFVEATNVMSVANVSLDATWIPTGSNTVSIGSVANPLAEIHATTIYGATGTLYLGTVPIKSDGTSIIADVKNTSGDAYVVAGGSGGSTNLSDYNNDAGFGTGVGDAVLANYNVFAESNRFDAPIFVNTIQHPTGEGLLLDFDNGAGQNIAGGNGGSLFIYGGGNEIVIDGELRSNGNDDNIGDSGNRWGTFFGTGVDVVGFATATSNAVSGTQLVNYQTMTNHIASGVNYAVDFAGDVTATGLGIGIADPSNTLHIVEGISEMLYTPSAFNPIMQYYRNDTSISSGNGLGEIYFSGRDNTGNVMTPHAKIRVGASGAHSSGDNPTKIEFYTTPDGSSTMGLAATIDDSGTLTTEGDTVLSMDDAAGTGTGWTEWAIGGTQDQNDNWRIGVVSSNLTIQVRVGGTWTNASVFTRP